MSVTPRFMYSNTNVTSAVPRDGNHRIRKVSVGGDISTIAGNGVETFAGDNDKAIDASLYYPLGVSVQANGTFYIADAYNGVIRKVAAQEAFSKYGLTLGEYLYTHDDNTADVFNKEGKLIKTINLATNTVLSTYTYDANDKIQTFSDQYGQSTTLAKEGDILTITAPYGEKTLVHLDDKGDLVKVAYEDNSNYRFTYFDGSLMDVMTDPNGNKIYHTFNNNGEIIEEVDGLQGSYRFLNTKNDKENIYTVAYPEGESTSTKETILANGDTKQVITDVSGDIMTLISAFDEMNSTSVKNNVTTIKEYEIDVITKQKNLASTKVIQPSGLTKTTTIHSIHNIQDNFLHKKVQQSTTNNKTFTTTYNYDTGETTTITPEGRTALYAYDASTLQLKNLKVGSKYQTYFEYDSKGKVTSEITGTRKNIYTYDTRGNLASVTNPRGKTISYGYDRLNRQTSITYPNGTSERFTYDANGNMLKRIVPTPAKHTFTYNGANLSDNYTSPLGKETLYTYDKNKRLTHTYKPSAATIENIYTKGRLSQTNTPEGNTTLTYLYKDQVDTVTNGSETFKYNYDGDLVSKVIQSGVLEHTLDLEYNNDFIIKNIKYAGVRVDYAYDKDGLLTSSGNYTLSKDPANGYTTKVTDGKVTQTRTYNGYGEVNKVEDNTFSYSITSRDAAGAITAKVEKLGSKTTTYTYAYDDNGRLIEVKKDANITESYSYDANGNRKEATLFGKTVTGRYTLDEQTIVYGDTTYCYDQDGYLFTKTTPQGITRYTYGTLGELRKVQTPTQTIEYLHNANNQRVAKLINGTVVEKYLWANLTTLLAIYDANDNLVQRFEYADQRMPVAMTQGSSKYYLHYDQVGSLRAVSDSSHNIIKEVTYDTYGNVLIDSNEAFTVPFGFAGGLYDVDTKLTRFGYRDYDAYTGKWTAKDPIGFDGGDSNLYGYVLGDPVNLFDSDGLQPKDKHYGHPKEFWNWYHDRIKENGDSDLDKKQSDYWNKEWEKEGKPKGDNKRKSRGGGRCASGYNPNKPTLGKRRKW